MHRTGRLHVIDRFFIFKVQMVASTVQNNFSYGYSDVDQILYFIYIFLLFSYKVRKSLDLTIMSHTKKVIF
jgi:hypothetical protein